MFEGGGRGRGKRKNDYYWTTHLFLSITPNKLKVSVEPSKSADRELSVESGLLEDMNCLDS